MARDLARQGEQRERLLQSHVAGLKTFGQRRALRLLALALLEVRAEAAVAQRDFFSGRGVLPQHAHARPLAVDALRLRLAGRRERPRKAALGIVRAADEGAVFAELQRQHALVAERAEAGIGAVGAWWKNMRTQQLVEAVEDLRGAEVLRAADGGGKIAPEIAQHLLPIDLAVGDFIELLLEIGGEVIADVAGEEGFEEGGDEAPLVLRNEPLLLDAHIVAVAEDRHGRGIGRRSADAELLHALDQGRLGVARRRLGEMLRSLDALLCKLFCFGHWG